MLSRLGKYEILGSLGQGAMGEVFLAKDPSIGRTLAIKTILASSTTAADAKERFAQEAKAAGALNHPGIVTIHEFGEDHGVLYLAMEFVEGDDLQGLLAQKTLSRADLLEILAQVSEALAYAHRKGVLHRDVKPSNIRVLRDGGRLQTKLMDFGIARISESTLTSTGLLMGTVAYMAPEYVKTGKADGRGDLFAVGVMLYEGLAGQLPFAGDTTATILYRLVHEPPRPLPPSALAGLSPALRGVLDHALAKEPERRYQDGDALAKALRAAKDPAWIGDDAAPTVIARRPAQASGNGKKWAAAAVIAAGLGAAAVGLLGKRHGEPPVVASSAPAPAPAASAPSGPSPAPLLPPPVQPEPKPEPKREPKREPKPAEAPKEAPPAEEEGIDPAISQGETGPTASQTKAAAAAKEIDTDPLQAHRDLAGLIQEKPRNPHFRALDLVALAKMGDGQGFVKAWDAAAAAGVDPKAMLLTPRFVGMLRAQRRDATLPPAAQARLTQAYGGEQLPQRQWKQRGN